MSGGRPGTGGDAPSPRQVEVLALVAQGMTGKEAAARLGITKHTVDLHLLAIYKKLGVHTRIQAVREAERRGLLPPSP